MLLGLKTHWGQKLLVISELHRQPSILLYFKNGRVSDRIVILVQRHVRPIVRGNARAAFEFGAKISVSMRIDFSFLHRISWDTYNEAEDLILQAKKYKQEYGCYSERIYADRIYIIPRTDTSALVTIYGSLVSDWGERRRIQRSVLLTSSSSAQTSGGEMKWKDAFDQGRGSIH